MDNEIQAIRDILNRQSRIALTIGIVMSALMLTYHFTFALVLEHRLTAIFIFEAISSVVFIVVFFMLRRISLALTRFYYRTSEPHGRLSLLMRPSDLKIAPEELIKRLRNSL